MRLVKDIPVQTYGPINEHYLLISVRKDLPETIDQVDEEKMSLRRIQAVRI